ncbi:MAG: hypothetical protein KatS3mg010_2071 [Acidimicrobiia bacterium]|nr:MAG: hypothetical protein KatS3mg010_2071 [Acidimicrobiia bacterium]
MSRRLQLRIGGMTCASCAARIEKRLDALDGVRATVNYALGTASVVAPEGVTEDDVVAAVEAAGYTASPVHTPSGEGEERRERDEDEETVASLRTRLLGSFVLSLPVVLCSMIPALQFTNWQWLALALAATRRAVGWLAVPPRGVANLKHATATMDTLISVGTLAAFGWSVWALLLGRGRRAGHEDVVRPHGRARRRDARDLPRGRDRRDRVHPRRPLVRGAGEAPVGRGAARAARARSEGRRRLCATAARCGSRSSSSRWATASSCGRARRSRPTASSSRARARSTRRC